MSPIAKKPIPRSRKRDYGRNLGRVWIVAIDAVVANARATTRVPIARHSTVSPVFEVSKLRAVALRTHSQGFGHGQLLAACEMKARRLPHGVARAALDGPVSKGQARVKLLQCIHA